MTGTEGRVSASEHQEQVALMEWAKRLEPQHPELALLYAIPNWHGHHSNPIQGARTAREGRKPGVPDLCLPVARQGYHGMYIEMKKVKGGRLRPEQIDWLSALNHQQYLAISSFGWVNAARAIAEYLDFDSGLD